MANGEVCKYCGYQETDHDLGRAKLEGGHLCRGFVSTVKHKRGCPVLGCDGNCTAMIASRIRDAGGAGFGGAILFVTPHGTAYVGD